MTPGFSSLTFEEASLHILNGTTLYCEDVNEPNKTHSAEKVGLDRSGLCGMRIIDITRKSIYAV